MQLNSGHIIEITACILTGLGEVFFIGLESAGGVSGKSDFFLFCIFVYIV